MKYSNWWWAKVIVLVTVFLVIMYFFAVALFSFSQITRNVTSAISNSPSEIVNAPSEACRSEVLLWRNNMKEIMNHQMFSVDAWQDGNVDRAIDSYTDASNKYMAITSPTCDADVELAHQYTGEELLLLGKSYKEALTGNSFLGKEYISQANEFLKKRGELFKIIDQRYNLN